jgi:hypothetical protein
MLGILGAHLLLLEPEFNPSLFQLVVATLRDLLGQHPDVEALALRQGNDGAPEAFTTPPMLRRSWRLVLERTVDHPELVPADSLMASVAPRIWGDGPWLLWLQRTDADLATDLSQMAASLQSQLRTISASQAALSGAPDEPLIQAGFEAEQGGLLGGGFRGKLGEEHERGVGALGLPRTPGIRPAMFAEAMEAVDNDTAPGEAVEAIDHDTATRLVQNFGLPRASIEQMLRPPR